MKDLVETKDMNEMPEEIKRNVSTLFYKDINYFDDMIKILNNHFSLCYSKREEIKDSLLLEMYDVYTDYYQFYYEIYLGNKNFNENEIKDLLKKHPLNKEKKLTLNDLNNLLFNGDIRKEVEMFFINSISERINVGDVFIDKRGGFFSYYYVISCQSKHNRVVLEELYTKNKLELTLNKLFDDYTFHKHRTIIMDGIDYISLEETLREQLDTFSYMLCGGSYEDINLRKGYKTGKSKFVFLYNLIVRSYRFYQHLLDNLIFLEDYRIYEIESEVFDDLVKKYLSWQNLTECDDIIKLLKHEKIYKQLAFCFAGFGDKNENNCVINE